MANDSPAAAEFQHLLNLREIALERLASIVGQVLNFWQVQDYAAAHTQLQKARNDFREADTAVARFRKTHSIGETRHGNRSAA